MAARVPLPNGTTETEKSPRQLVISAYATVPDVRAKVTPDVKTTGDGSLLFVDLGPGARGPGRLSALSCARSDGPRREPRCGLVEAQGRVHRHAADACWCFEPAVSAGNNVGCSTCTGEHTRVHRAAAVVLLSHGWRHGNPAVQKGT